MTIEPLLCDTHVHVFDPRRFPYVTPRRFTPGEATAAQLAARMGDLGIGTAVIIQPSVYGANNACLEEALKTLQGRARGVAVLSEGAPLSEIRRLDAAGVRGARVNLVVDRVEDPAVAIAKLAGATSLLPWHWHLQLHVSTLTLSGLADYIVSSKRNYVLDHIGLPVVGETVTSASWKNLLELLRSGNLYVKLSAPYLSSLAGPPYEDLVPFIRSLMIERPDRLLWGSNWPHTLGTARSSQAALDVVEDFRQVDDRLWMGACRAIAGATGFDALNRNAEALYWSC
ncbi:amidohydrolase [Polaromonas sp. CF318]|uniref:amidohydrolase family protein n=1 Tax=Polaromonas sp. CF318 TaxID=1144318 RepID=UPI000684F054|nr:amidohydrolase family protein [Polaromonas sp. CF318]